MGLPGLPKLADPGLHAWAGIAGMKKRQRRGFCPSKNERSMTDMAEGKRSFTPT
jgi:hypothetical protein